MKLKTFTRKDVENKKVLVRVDLNVPFKNGKVQDDSRIRAHASTIGKLAGAGVALISHFGRPKGKVVPEMSLGQIVGDVEKAYGRPVRFVDDCVGEKVREAVRLAKDELLLLENVRFHEEEQKDDANFAARLGEPFDVFVMDAFSASHRADASTHGIMSVLPSFAGDVLVKEGEMLGAVSEPPLNKPYVLILGGAKVSDKINVVGNLLDKADTILIGGGMAYTFLKAQGYAIGKSLCEEDRLDFARATLEKAKEKGVKILLPADSVVAGGLEAEETALADSGAMPEDKLGLDIGPKTAKLFAEALDGARSILWNGPMGVFENKLFAEGTIAVGNAVAKATGAGATSVIGGGDTASAIRQFGFEDKVSYVSTGGGASLEYCEGKKLPGMAPLELK